MTDHTEADNIAQWRKLRIPFAHLLGISIHGMADGHSELRQQPKPEHLNSHGAVHGGLLMTLMDVTMAAAGRSVEPSSGMVTIEMKTSFMRPAHGPVTAYGKLLHRTRKMAFLEAIVVNAQGENCAHATGTFKFVPRAPGAAAAGTATD